MQSAKVQADVISTLSVALVKGPTRHIKIRHCSAPLIGIIRSSSPKCLKRSGVGAFGGACCGVFLNLLESSIMSP